MTMKILLVGGGGREHAIAEALCKNSEIELFSVMAKKNPGIWLLAKRVLIEKETNIRRVAGFASAIGVQCAIIGPESPLEAGIADALEELEIACVGPTREAARLETDKGFCRSMMERHGIAGCPKYRVFRDQEAAIAFIEASDQDLAVKPVGLTGGKGVRIMGEHVDRDGAVDYVRQLGGHVVVEERLTGEEFTLQAFVDGSHLIPMPLVQDHKRAFEGDQGPNTGGMGSYSMPDHGLPFVTAGDRERAMRIMKDVVKVMADIGQPYRGILYGQFMNTSRGPMVIEFNARFGDPEAMNVLSLLESDFGDVMARITSGTLSRASVRFAKEATVCKYLVPEGYPETPRTGRPLIFGDYGSAFLYYANVDIQKGQLLTQSSRTLAFVGKAGTLEEAEEIAEKAASSVSGDIRYRRDIGTQSLLQRRIEHMKEIR
ncbi:MAG TPA: phosphoribosylamine--glycine ligase [Methanoregulaceae archaeon]|nr:phosphoribosylamine--glycine ligase [Methanoregulaceae archaeon]